MASTIRIKRSSVAGKVPTVSDIATGELAINTKDQKLYSSNGTAVFGFTDTYIQKTFNIVGDFTAPVPGSARFVPVSNTTITKVRLTNSVTIADNNLVVNLNKNGAFFKTFTLPVGSYTRSFANTFTLKTNEYLTVDINSGSGSNFSLTISN